MKELFLFRHAKSSWDNPDQPDIERTLNERFVQLRSFYLFDTRFCNIASGNEKGDVENLVKRSQRTYLTPVPEVTGISTDLAQKLEADCRRDLLKVGGSALAGLTLPSMFQLQNATAEEGRYGGPGFGKAKSVILIYL